METLWVVLVVVPSLVLQNSYSYSSMMPGSHTRRRLNAGAGAEADADETVGATGVGISVVVVETMRRSQQ